jgi:hypothetical protein
MESELSRPQAVRALLEFSAPLETLQHQLAQFPWDSEAALAILTPSNVTDVLLRYLAEELSAGDVEAWAECIEGREDVGFEPGQSDLLSDFVFGAANPVLNGAITVKWAKDWITRLGSAER